MDVRVGGGNIPFPPTLEGRAAAAKFQEQTMSTSDISLPEIPIGSKPTARQLAFLSFPFPDTVPATKNTTPSPAATQIIATINQKRQEITAAATAAADELAELETIAIALGASVPPSTHHSPNSPTLNTAAALQRTDKEQAATRPPTHTSQEEHVPPQMAPPSPAAQKPGLHQTDNNNDSQPDKNPQPDRNDRLKDSVHSKAPTTAPHIQLPLQPCCTHLWPSEGFNLHIRQSLIAGIGLNFTDKEKIAGLAASTG